MSDMKPGPLTPQSGVPAVPLSAVGQPGGVASLGSDGKVPAGQVNSAAYVSVGATTDAPGLGLFFPEAHGAKGDAATDDTTGVQAAATAAQAVGGTLWLGQTYKISAPITGGSYKVDGPGGLTGDVAPAPDGGLLTVGAATKVHRVTLNNTHATACLGIDFAANATNVSIDGVVFTGQTQQAVNINKTGIAHVNITRCVCSGVAYGVLTNTAATDLFDVRVVNNTFVNIFGDAIEFNHPSGGSAYSKAKKLVVADNYISVPNGTDPNQGFGVGIAGAADITITGNTFDGVRLQAIHLEDKCRNITITGNTFDGGGKHIYSIDSAFVTVAGNTFKGGSYGIQFDYDASHEATQVSVTGNVLTGGTGDGIYVGGNTADYVTISNNQVQGYTGNGITVVGTFAAGAVTVTGNSSTGNTGYGMSVSNRTTVTIADNLLAGNTAGDYTTTGSMYPQPIRGQRATAIASGVLATSTSTAVNLVNLGQAAKGTLTVNVGTAGNNYETKLFDISWDGTTLTQTTVKDIHPGSLASLTIAMSGTTLTATVFWGGGSTQNVTFDAHFDGIALR